MVCIGAMLANECQAKPYKKGEVLTLGADVNDQLGRRPRELPLQIAQVGLYEIDMLSYYFEARLELFGPGTSIRAAAAPAARITCPSLRVPCPKELTCGALAGH